MNGEHSGASAFTIKRNKNKKVEEKKVVEEYDSVGDDYEEQEDADDYCKGGYYPVKLGNIFATRYYIIRKLGWGQFSTVWLAWNLPESKFVAIKIVKCALQYTEAALDEISMLKRIRETNPNDEKRERVIQLLDHFKEISRYGTHMCMVFSVLGYNLLRLITESDYKGIEISQVKNVIRQILEGLVYLHDVCGIIHCDIKPENILLAVTNDQIHRMAAEALEMAQKGEEIPANFICSEKKDNKFSERDLLGAFSKLPASLNDDKKEIRHQLLRAPDPLGHSSVVIADLGNACWVNNHFSDEIQTRQYRAIEVLLGANYGPAADIWSVGCVAYELATGSYLFNAQGSKTASPNENHIAMITSLLGPIPKHVAFSGNKDAFTSTGELRRELKLPAVDLERLLREEGGLDSGNARAFAEFLRFLLQLDPLQRPSAKQCLAHPWFHN
ncbi:hypothetical protein B566_EDAN014553 [Ephemera danica]|nr:hypothetical protein B566_EDAN014553 [Ephemera danica]